MGRSKFPGKPSKHIHRKRINVLPPTGDISNVEFSGSVTVESVVENKQEEDVSEKDSESPTIDNVVNTKVSIKRRLTRKMKSSIRNKNTSKRNLLSKICNKPTVKPKINKGTSLTRKTVHSYTSTCRSKTPKETTNLVGKFVLPTRSVHSSRVIKPNKRFISDLNESLTLKKKVSITKRNCVKQDDDKSKSKTKCNDSGSFNSDSDKTTFTNGHKVVLRQARLKLPNQTGTQGPFSTKPNSSPPGTVTCGVCGAVRFYRFVKQARKFNIYSCESCRKFITKMIKRQACGGKNTQVPLVCNKGQGTCHVPPIVRSQQWKLTKCAYRARCPACWLKMCLRAFHMPPYLKQGLTLMLPKNMQGLDIVLNNTLPPLLWQAKVDQKLVLDKPQETTSLKQRPVRFKNPKAQITPNPPIQNSDIKRQKIDLKGPRVKHVCRSASIVLGQPIATFTETEKKCDTQDTPTADIKLSEDKVLSDKNEVKASVSIAKNDSISSSPSESESNCSDKTAKIQFSFSYSSDTSFKREKSFRSAAVSSNSNLEARASERKKNLIELQNGILIDFWDGYDPESICQNGFCIIGSEQFPVSAICFLCGSAGRETMLYCSICCEPYHPFCLEDAQAAPISKDAKQGLWICPRCTKCYECNQIDRQKISCHKCLKAYHPECFNPKWNGEEKPTVCVKCLMCKSCGTSGITKFIGNIPLCILCFKLRKKGNFCPICQHCYDENECCSKMMECAKCTKWVHATCENLTDERYHILSNLPESVEYFCSSCSKKPYWRRAINIEMRSCFNQILRQLSKNKVARSLLKWSPMNNLTPSNKAITHIRKLQFSDEDIDLDNNNYSKDIADVNKIYSFEENEKYEESMSKATNSLSVVDIRNKVNSNEYSSIKEFHKEIEEALKLTKSEQLLKIYHSILQEVFPWYEKITSEVEEPQKLENITNYESQNITKEPNEEDPFTEIIPPIIDTRVCGFCKGVGDGKNSDESRLLYCGQNEWVHANCALWSSEVYEEIDGSLQNVQSALNRGRLIRCAYCKQKGASIGCCYKGCHETYHFSCARTAKLVFMHDKTVYCSSHEVMSKSHVITVDKDFEIRRSVYVELEQKRKKYCEIEKVNFMIGSLYINNLGKIYPLVSDSAEAIIPLGFVCSRLFWSTVEPWKLVPYTISTSIQNYNNSILTVDKNFTIDHTLEKTAVDKIMRELNAWQRDIDKKNSDTESEDDEEQQNGADILSPELTDAILEELPHDLLDGISVQDIFPKFSYDDLITMDYKTELSNLESITENFKKTEIDDEIDLDTKTNRELRRSKSDVICCNKFEGLSKSRPSHRSCSLTLSCKLDSSLSPAIKRRKMAAARENNMIYQLLQVDGNCDDSSSSECGSPTGMPETDPWGNYVSEEPVTCEKCQCTYRTQASYKRHIDSCEVLCTSESDSEMIPDQEMVSYVNPATSSVENSVMVDVNEPVVISSFESYQSEIHTSVLNTQSFVTSKSTSELVAVPQTSDLIVQNLPQAVEQKQILQTLPVNTVTPISIENHQADQTYTISQPITIADPSISITTNQPQFCVNQTVPLCVNQPSITLQQNSIQVQPTASYTGNQVLSINPSGSISLNSLSQPTASLAINQINQSAGSIAINQLNQPTNLQQSLDFQPQSVTIQSVPYSNAILNVGNQNQFSLNGKLLTNPVIQTVNMPGAQWMKQLTKPLSNQKAIKSRGRSRTIAAKRSTHFEDGDTIILPAQNSTGQVIVQHLPSTNYVPTFVDAFQHPGQNLQYVATITPQVNTMPAQSLVQIQPENNIISIVPGLQQTMYIQQPRVLENQLIVDSNGTLGWSQQQTVQPVYYGFETIVQNTVMQSQQFLPTTMPGVLTANSSYSTTTQVFQTSKLEPVLDVPSNSFVLVNPGQLVNSQSIVNSQPIVNPQPIVNTQPLVNSQPMVNSQSIVNVQPIVSSQQVEVQYSETRPLNIASSIVPQLPSQQQPEVHTSQQQQIKYSQPVVPHKPPTVPTTSATHSITLPTAPFVSEQGIPTNIVTPIPKPPTLTQSRPMSRVLPMPTNNAIKEAKKIISDDPEKLFFTEEKRKSTQANMEDIKSPPLKPPKVTNNITKLDSKKFEILQCKIIKPAPPTLPKATEQVLEVKPTDLISFQPVEKPQKIEIVSDIKLNIKEEAPVVQKPVESTQREDTKIDKSLKLVFQKQGQDGTYKISSNFSTKQPIQVAPLKPIKSSQTQITPPSVVEKQFNEEEKLEDKLEKLSSEIPSSKLQMNKKENDNSSSVLYTIETQDGFKYSSSSVADLWTKVLEAVQTARAAHNMPPLPTNNRSIMNSIQILGFRSSGLKYLIEQLPGASKCSKYKSMFNFPPHPSDIDDEYSQDHLYGAIRCAPYENKNLEPYDMFGWLSSKHRQPEEMSLDTLELLPRRVVNLPMAMKFRQLKLTSKYSVGVYRSCIHGRGLFCLRDIEAGEMVIEYAGEVIRSILTDKREKFYNSKGIGCYMFRVDDNFVVDATMKGNAARFINHSCDPNCYSRVVEILGHKHIIIFALRRILSGEELTYDYKFPFEEDKIPCTCGSRKCRKFLN